MPTRTAPQFSATWTQILLGGWLALTVLFWALNPGATEGYGVLARFVFWAVHVAVPLALCQLAQTLLGGWQAKADWIPILAAGVLGGLAFVPIAAGLDAVFPDLDGTDEAEGVASLLSELISTLLPVTLCWCVLNGPRLLKLQSPEAPKASEPAFWAKVPAEIGRELVSLSAELHYLRVRTTDGDALVLYPFGRAVEALEGDGGQQIHRSHWIAYRHVQDWRRKGEGAEVTLLTGDILPVSRRYRKTFSEAMAAQDSPVTRAK